VGVGAVRGFAQLECGLVADLAVLHLTHVAGGDDPAVATLATMPCSHGRTSGDGARPTFQPGADLRYGHPAPAGRRRKGMFCEGDRSSVRGPSASSPTPEPSGAQRLRSGAGSAAQGDGAAAGDLFEEVVALVVDHHEGGEVLDLDLPDRLHAELG